MAAHRTSVRTGASSLLSAAPTQSVVAVGPVSCFVIDAAAARELLENVGMADELRRRQELISQVAIFKKLGIAECALAGPKPRP